MAVNVNVEQESKPTPRPHAPVLDVTRTACCIAGGGPAGAMLALLLARKGVEVVLLEKHADFDRDFRGDTIHPGVMEILDQIGLADRLLALPHAEMQTMSARAKGEEVPVADFRLLRTRFPFVNIMPQAEFLDFITAEAKRYPSFRLVMNANVQELIERDGIVRGVRYQGLDGRHEVRALLTVGADGRFSRIRHLAGFEPIETSSPIDVLWFRLPRRPGDGHGGLGTFYKGAIFVMLERSEEWQIAYVIAKGGYKAIHAAGLDELRRRIAAALPQLADRVDTLTSWKQFSLLAVESSRVERWYKPGLLLIGDAAHVMSPVGGVGINYAIQDAVVAANLLTAPLRAGRIRMRTLAEVQRQREWPTRVMQTLQSFLQQQVLQSGLAAGETFTPPPIDRLPFVRALVARLVGYGVRRARLDEG
jgi:2-polyprenyl-6-methoxyphenol hydroxylase-like FAD-dependent oxidoreductase